MEAINSAELDWAIKSINNRFIFSFGSTEQVARQQLMLEVEKLPRDHLLKYQDRIKQTGSGDIKRAVSRYLTSTETVILVTGKESDFDQPLADFGKVEKLSVND
jgi:predicted Zn-dependent peptidase